MVKRILHIVSWVAMFVYMIITMGAISSEMSVRRCNDLVVEVMNGTGSIFVDANDIKSILKRNKLIYKNVRMDSISTENIELCLQAHPWMDDVQCFKTVNNCIKVNVWQRTPVVRVMTGRENFYLDAAGNRMPPTLNNAAYVPVVTGISPDSAVQSQLLILVDYINDDRFLKSQIQQLHINRSKEFVLIPRAGKHEILFGDVSWMEGKFSKLKTLYKEEFGENGWNRYRVIDLRFNNQVVCTKK